ncbi:MAG: ArsR/SmtB family transcription factor [Candidatus Helarchaeota archaeon]
MQKRELRLKILKSISDGARLQILEMLRHGEEICSCDIQEQIKKSQSTTYNHLKILTDADILVARKDGTKMMYKVRDFHVYKILADIDKLLKNVKKYKEIVRIQDQILA